MKMSLKRILINRKRHCLHCSSFNLKRNYTYELKKFSSCALFKPTTAVSISKFNYFFFCGCCFVFLYTQWENEYAAAKVIWIVVCKLYMELWIRNSIIRLFCNFFFCCDHFKYVMFLRIWNTFFSLSQFEKCYFSHITVMVTLKSYAFNFHTTNSFHFVHSIQFDSE